ncbi:MAG: hypothetical protein B7X10_00675, partial [Burkholderiales bacterium 21-58-4]
PNFLIESSHIYTSALLVKDTDLIVPMSRATAQCVQSSMKLKVLDLKIGNHGSMGLLWRPEDKDETLIQDFMSCARRQSLKMVV